MPTRVVFGSGKEVAIKQNAEDASHQLAQTGRLVQVERHPEQGYLWLNPAQVAYIEPIEENG